ncbi:hypothetical protein HanIR_Chr02g0073331 [Helianthus annuus]|nr:hypothetical protein HanIR_Chr02g0073331 [Helianthus annuus]
MGNMAVLNHDKIVNIIFESFLFLFFNRSCRNKSALRNRKALSKSGSGVETGAVTEAVTTELTVGRTVTDPVETTELTRTVEVTVADAVLPARISS